MKMSYDGPSGKSKYGYGLPVGDSNWKTLFLLIFVFFSSLVESQQTKYHKYHNIKSTDVHHGSYGYDNEPKKSERMVQGTPAEAHEFTSFGTLLEISDQYVICAATLISNRLALTAAHCIAGKNLSPSAYELLVGENDMSKINDTGSARKYQITKFVLQPDYVDDYDKITPDDIAIIETLEEMRFDDNVSPACLPFKFSDPMLGQSATVVGWKRNIFNFPEVLLKASVIINEPSFCARFVETIPNEKQICAYGDSESARRGDSGGPLYYKDPETDALVLIGVISGGSLWSGNGPSVNARVHSYLSWIKSNYPGETFCGQ